jgi:flagellar hook-length control protein FliK
MMVVNAALFQETAPAAGAGGAKGGGATDPQGGSFAKLLSGHASKDAANQPGAPGQSATQYKRSSAASRAEASRANQAQKGEQREDQVEQSAQEEPLLEVVKELTVKAQAQQEVAADAADAAELVSVAAKAGVGNAPVATGNGKALVPTGKQETPAASEPGGEVKGATSGGDTQLPLNGSAVAAPPAGAMAVATIAQQQVVAQNAAQLQVNASATSGGEKGHAAPHARRKGGEGEAVSGGTKATDGKEQAQQDAPATLAAMLFSGAAMVTAGGTDPGAVAADVEAELAGVTAPAATSVGTQQRSAAGGSENEAAAKAVALPQVAARGEQSSQLEALQQKALELAAAAPELAVAERPVSQGAEASQGGGGAAQQMVQSATQQGPAQLISTSAAATPQQAAAPAEKPVAPQRFVATPVAGASFQAASGMATAGDKEPAAGASTAQIVSNAVTATGDKVAVVNQDEGAEPKQAHNAPELSTQQTQNSGKGIGIPSTDPAKRDPFQPENAAAQEPGKQEASAVAAQRKEPRETGTGHHAGDGAKIAAEPAAVNQKTATDEISGTKTAVTAASPRPAVPGSTGQNGSGEAGEKGHQEQQAQNQPPQPQPATAGMMQFTAARELSQPAATPSSPQSALHESVLSQVKDAVVSHDGKGNGEMSIRLNPGELGELKIQVRMEDNRVRVEVQADNKMVKDLLLSNLDSLKDALSGKNFTMDGFDVSTGTGGGFNSPLPEQREAAQQQAMARSSRPAAYSAPEETRVNYMTAEVNNLLDVRF